MTTAPPMKMGVLAMTNAMAAMSAPTSMTMTQVQAAGLLPWPSSWLWSMTPGATVRVPDVEADAGALLMEISSGWILLTFCHFLAAARVPSGVPPVPAPPARPSGGVVAARQPVPAVNLVHGPGRHSLPGCDGRIIFGARLPVPGRGNDQQGAQGQQAPGDDGDCREGGEFNVRLAAGDAGGGGNGSLRRCQRVRKDGGGGGHDAGRSKDDDGGNDTP